MKMDQGNREIELSPRRILTSHLLIATVVYLGGVTWLTTVAADELTPAADKIELRIRSNPTVSNLSKATSGITQIRFEEYVSNPPPKTHHALQGWVGHFPVPFTGLVRPQATNTTVVPLPEPIGLLIESSADSVGFYDPSSLVECADVRADKLIFRFVDPTRTSRAATVSRVALRITGTSVVNGKVRYSIYDSSGKTLGSGVAMPDPTTRRAESEIDCEALLDGQNISAIHKIVVEHTGPGYFVVGSVMRPEQADLAFDGFTVTGQTVSRPIGEQIATAHSEQWEQVAKAELITDMTRCIPADALSERRKHDSWKVFEYETAEFSGKCVSVGRESSAPDLTLKLGRQGWHAVYVGLSTITDLVPR